MKYCQLNHATNSFLFIKVLTIDLPCEGSRCFPITFWSGIPVDPFLWLYYVPTMRELKLQHFCDRS
jgi:hypothetical protein